MDKENDANKQSSPNALQAFLDTQQNWEMSPGAAVDNFHGLDMMVGHVPLEVKELVKSGVSITAAELNHESLSPFVREYLQTAKEAQTAAPSSVDRTHTGSRLRSTGPL